MIAVGVPGHAACTPRLAATQRFHVWRSGDVHIGLGQRIRAGAAAEHRVQLCTTRNVGERDERLATPLRALAPRDDRQRDRAEAQALLGQAVLVPNGAPWYGLRVKTPYSTRRDSRLVRMFVAMSTAAASS